MSNIIKVRPRVYDQLNELRGKSSTFNEIIEDLLDNRIRLCEFLNSVEGSMKFRQWQLDRLKKIQPGQEGK